jgi:hypothetical protein
MLESSFETVTVVSPASTFVQMRTEGPPSVQAVDQRMHLVGRVESQLVVKELTEGVVFPQRCADITFR